MATYQHTPLPSNPSLRTAWLSFELKQRGKTISSFARELGVSTHAVSKTMNAASARLEEAIAGELGMSLHALFPERYSPSGIRLTPSRPRQYANRRGRRGERRKTGSR